MAVAPLIAMKSTKCESLEAVARELDRRAHTYVNDVDPTRSGLNEVYCCERDGKPLTLDEAVEQRVGELHTKRAVRKDAVKAMGFIVSTNDALSDEQASEFLNDALRWFAKRYGQENMLGAAIHYDEDTPHLHLWLAPVISEDGWDRLCAAKLFTPDKRERFDEDGHKLKKGQEPEKGKVVWKVTERGTMSILQEDFWREVASKYGYDHPLDRETRGKGYRSLEAYKTHVGTTRALRREAKEARDVADKAAGDATRALAAKDEAERKAGEAQDELNGLGDKVTELTTKRDQLQKEIRDLGQAKDEAEKAVTNLNTDIALKSGTLKQLKFDIGLEQKRLDELRPKVDNLKTERDQLKDEVSTLQKTKQAVKDELAALLDAVRAGRWGKAIDVVHDVLVTACDHLLGLARERKLEWADFHAEADEALADTLYNRASAQVAAELGRDEQER